MQTDLCEYPGRVCLLGEHCDWYGGASLTVPLPMTVRARAADGDHALSVDAELDGVIVSGVWDGPAVEPGGGPLRFVPAAWWLLREEEGLRLPRTHLTVRADLPTGRGFSSSAAFCLAILDALGQAAGERLEAGVLAEHAFTVEHTLLGVACGRLDPLACVARAPVAMEWERGRAQVRSVAAGAPMWMVVGAFAAPRDTPGILAALQRRGPGVGAALAIFAEAARRGAVALAAGDVVGLGRELDAAQDAYESFLLPMPELAAPALVRACGGLRRRGAVGAKFSGAGGDGSVVALFARAGAAEAARDWMAGEGLAAWVVPLGV